MGSSKAAPNAARRGFVKASGIFGKYLYRGMSYVAENAIAFLGLTATIVVLFSIAAVFGITIPVIVAAAESAIATLAGMPLLGATVALAAAIAAPETLKKIYKECTEWVVGAYQNVVKNWFMPKDFTLSKEKEQHIKSKYSQLPGESDEDYSERIAPKLNLEEKYSKVFNGKTASLDLPGICGKKRFKAAANSIADSAEWVAGAPKYLYSCLPGFNCFSSSKEKAENDASRSGLNDSLLENPKKNTGPKPSQVV
jgi:hypothetical protein